MSFLLIRRSNEQSGPEQRGINQELHFTARVGLPALRLVGFLPSTVSKRFFLLESGKRMQRTAYSLRNHGSEAFVA